MNSTSQTLSNGNGFPMENSIHRFEVQGAEIATDVWKNSEQPQQLLVLLNGFQRPRTDFRSFRKKFHSKFPNFATLAIDLRGSGETKIFPNSSWPAPTSGINSLAQDVQSTVAAVLDLLKLSSYSVLGISMGGMVAQELAYICPHVENVVLVSTLPKGAPAGDALSYANKVRASNKLDSKDLYGYFGNKIIREQPIFVEAFLSYVYADNTRETKSARWQRQAIDYFDSTRWLATLPNRFLVIHGNEDKVAPIEEALPHFSKLKNLQTILYEEVGHLILVEEIEKFVSDVGNFLTLKNKNAV